MLGHRHMAGWPGEDTGRKQHPLAKERGLRKNQRADIWILNSQPLELWGNECVLFKLPSSEYLLQQPQQTQPGLQPHEPAQADMQNGEE